MAKDRVLTGNQLATKTSHGVRAPGWLGRWPIIGIVMVLVGILAFGTLAYNVETKGPLLQWDVPLANTLHRDAVHTSPHLIQYVIFGFYLGREMIQVVALILIVYFLHKRFWPELAMVVIGVGGAAVIWYTLSRFFERPRPPVQMGIVVSDPSFPSGHVISAIACYGLLAYLLVPKMPSRFWKWVIVIAAVAVILFITFSRLFLGGHYLTDVLAGYAIGIAWAGLVYTLIERIFVKR